MTLSSVGLLTSCAQGKSGPHKASKGVSGPYSNIATCILLAREATRHYRVALTLQFAFSGMKRPQQLWRCSSYTLRLRAWTGLDGKPTI